MFRWGKREIDEEHLRPARASPLRWGKRSMGVYEDMEEDKRAPLRWDKLIF